MNIITKKRLSKRFITIKLNKLKFMRLVSKEEPKKRYGFSARLEQAMEKQKERLRDLQDNGFTT